MKLISSASLMLAALLAAPASAAQVNCGLIVMSAVRHAGDASTEAIDYFIDRCMLGVHEQEIGTPRDKLLDNLAAEVSRATAENPNDRKFYLAATSVTLNAYDQAAE